MNRVAGSQVLIAPGAGGVGSVLLLDCYEHPARKPHTKGRCVLYMSLTDIDHFICDAAWLRELSGWELVVDLGDGLRCTPPWYKANDRVWSVECRGG